MNTEEKAKHQENVKGVIALLQLLHDSLDGEVLEPECVCSYCDKVFATRSVIIEHVSVCEKNPLVVEIERLHTELVKRENRIAVLFRRITKLEQK